MTGRASEDPASDPLVSIITPTLNQGPFIGEMIRSIQSQSYKHIEHIVIDGGSTDETIAILQDAAARSPLTWRSESDKGMYDALNKGIHAASGEILSYLNSDDLLLPWAIEAVVEAFATNPEADLVFGDALRLDEATGSLELKLQVDLQPGRIARFGSLVQPSVFWRRGLLDSLGGFDSSLEFVGDLDFWLRARGRARASHLQEVLSVFRVHPAAKTSLQRQAMRGEERAMRARHHRDGRLTVPWQVLARASHGLAERAQMLRFATATRRGADPRWRRIREQLQPRIRSGPFLLALLPLLGRAVDLRWLEIRDPRA